MTVLHEQTIEKSGYSLHIIQRINIKRIHLF